MSHAITFDTHAFVKRLESSGIAVEHSEAITEAMADVFEISLNAVPAKTDFQLLDIKIEKMGLDFDGKLSKISAEFDSKLSKIAAKFESKLSKLKTEIITWVVGLVFAQTAVLSMIKFMH